MLSRLGSGKLFSNGSLKGVFTAAMDLFLHLAGAEGTAFLLKDGEGVFRPHLARGLLWEAIGRQNFELLVGNFARELQGQAVGQTSRASLIHKGEEMVVYLLGMPVNLRGQEPGVIVAASCKERFTWENVDVLVHVAAHLQKVVDTTEPGEYQYFLDDSRMLPDLPVTTHNLKFSLDLRELLLSIADLLQEVADYDICLLFLPGFNRECLFCEILKMQPEVEFEPESCYPVGEGIFPQVFGEKTPLLIGNIKQDEGFDNWDLKGVVTSLLAVPVLVEGESMGVLIIGSREANFYRRKDLDTLRAFASQVGVLNRLAANADFWEEYHHHIIESVPVAIISINPEGNIMTYNCEAKKLLGLLGDEFKGLHYGELLAKTRGRLNIDPPGLRIGDKIEGVLRTGVPFKKWALRIVCKGKKDLIVSLSISPIQDSGGRILGATIVIEDVTEKRRLEQNLREAEKMAALGQLAVGVAHEIRNPLTTIKGFSQLLQQRGYSPPDLAGYMENILAEVDKIGTIIHNLLLLSNSTRIETEPVDLNLLLESLLPLLQSEAALTDVEISYHLRGKFPPLEADQGELHRAFLNIFLNALQAMPYGGVLTINTVYWARKGEIWVRVTDTGCGIADEDYKHIFNPFFTTKDEAVGLGLSVAYQIIQKHGGEIVVNSIVEKGTTVTVKLPVDNTVSRRGKFNG